MSWWKCWRWGFDDWIEFGFEFGIAFCFMSMLSRANVVPELRLVDYRHSNEFHTEWPTLQIELSLVTYWNDSSATAATTTTTPQSQSLSFGDFMFHEWSAVDEYYILRLLCAKYRYTRKIFFQNSSIRMWNAHLWDATVSLVTTEFTNHSSAPCAPHRMDLRFTNSTLTSWLDNHCKKRFADMNDLAGYHRMSQTVTMDMVAYTQCSYMLFMKQFQ